MNFSPESASKKCAWKHRNVYNGISVASRSAIAIDGSHEQRRQSPREPKQPEKDLLRDFLLTRHVTQCGSQPMTKQQSTLQAMPKCMQGGLSTAPQCDVMPQKGKRKIAHRCVILMFPSRSTDDRHVSAIGRRQTYGRLPLQSVRLLIYSLFFFRNADCWLC